jgi:hypothetical protein
VFLWAYKVEAEMDDAQFIKIMQFFLTYWAGKCNRPMIYQPKSERTFWIDRIIPIFQSIGDQTGLVGFELCETNPTSHTETTMQQDSWKRGPSRNVDGLGRNEHGAEIIVMEGSSGQTNEDITHTKDDTLQKHSWLNLRTGILVETISRRSIINRRKFASLFRPVCLLHHHHIPPLALTHGTLVNTTIKNAELQKYPWTTVKGWIG